MREGLSIRFFSCDHIKKLLEKAAGAPAVEEAAAVMPRDVTVTARISLVYNIG